MTTSTTLTHESKKTKKQTNKKLNPETSYTHFGSRLRRGNLHDLRPQNCKRNFSHLERTHPWSSPPEIHRLQQNPQLQEKRARFETRPNRLSDRRSTTEKWNAQDGRRPGSAAITSSSGRRWPAWRRTWSADPSCSGTWSWHPRPPSWRQ